MISSHPIPMIFTGSVPPSPPRRQRADRVDQSIAAAHVLIIEDELMIAWMIESLIEDMGFASIAVAADGVEALRMAKDAPPGLVISDINLGRAPDGVETVARIRSTIKTAVLFVSGYANKDAKERIDRTIIGAKLLRKPIEAASLRTAIIDLLAPKLH